MSSQLLVNVLTVTLDPGATVILAHGLKVANVGVVPTQVIPDRPTTIGVLNVNTLGVEFVNLGPDAATAAFRVEFDHSVHATGAPTVAWQGWTGTTGGGGTPTGPAGGVLGNTGSLYPDPNGLAGIVAANVPAVPNRWVPILPGANGVGLGPVFDDSPSGGKSFVIAAADATASGAAGGTLTLRGGDRADSLGAGGGVVLRSAFASGGSVQVFGHDLVDISAAPGGTINLLERANLLGSWNDVAGQLALRSSLHVGPGAPPGDPGDPGTVGQVLTSAGIDVAPTWQDASGTPTGPAGGVLKGPYPAPDGLQGLAAPADVPSYPARWIPIRESSSVGIGPVDSTDPAAGDFVISSAAAPTAGGVGGRLWLRGGDGGAGGQNGMVYIGGPGNVAASGGPVWIQSVGDVWIDAEFGKVQIPSAYGGANVVELGKTAPTVVPVDVLGPLSIENELRIGGVSPAGDPGSLGYVLTSTGAGGPPSWQASTAGSPVAVYGCFSDLADQPITTGVHVVQFDTTEAAYGVSVVNDPITLLPTRLTVSAAGVYAVNLSPQLVHVGGGTETITFWIRKNGVNVPNSASSLEMGNNNNRTLPFIESILMLTAGDYVEWAFTASTGTDITLEHFPAAGAVPAIPSVIANIKRLGS